MQQVGLTLTTLLVAAGFVAFIFLGGAQIGHSAAVNESVNLTDHRQSFAENWSEARANVSAAQANASMGDYATEAMVDATGVWIIFEYGYAAFNAGLTWGYADPEGYETTVWLLANGVVYGGILVAYSCYRKLQRLRTGPPLL